MNKRQVCLILAAGLLICATAAVVPSVARGDHPRPSIYPISWELKFTHGMPKRIVVEPPGQTVPQAYWYMTYSVTNNTDRERTFLPFFELVTREGKVIRSDKHIPARVFEAIKAREKNRFMQPSWEIAGELRVGEDQAKEGVAIWPEPEARMGQFAIYVGELSGEIAAVKDSAGQPVKDGQGKPVILRKTLQLNYLIRGDEVYPGEDEVNEQAERWVMR